tara:strand:+ start:157 stop:420 length:264 start_codon:yes stop_codon:yes gene_type:complete
MSKKTREELIREFAEFTAERMSEDTLKRIAVITLLANIDPASTREDWEDYVARMDPLMKSEDLLQMIQPHVIMTKPVKARSAEASES